VFFAAGTADVPANGAKNVVSVGAPESYDPTLNYDPKTWGPSRASGRRPD